MNKELPDYSGIPIPLIGTDIKGRVLWANKQARKLLPESLLNNETPLYKGIFWLKEDSVRLKSLLNSDSDNTVSVKIVSPLGHQDSSLWRRIWIDENRDPQVLISIELKDDAHLLRRRYNALVKLVEDFQNIIPLGLITIDKNGVIKAITPKAQEVFYPLALHKNMSIKGLEGVMGKEWMNITQSSEQSGARRIELTDNVDNLQNSIDILMDSKNIRLLDVEFFRFEERTAFFLEDITKKQELEESIQELLDLKDFAELVLGAAREINNLLGVISARIQYIEKHTDDPEKVKQTMDIIQKKTEQNGILIKSLQNYANLRLAYKFYPLDLVELIKDFVKTEKSIWQIGNKKISMSLHLKLDKAVINGNYNELIELMRILLRNSVDAIKTQGEIVLQIREENKKIVLEVNDNGIGIPKEFKSKVFQAFFTTKPSPAKGTGLNIAMGIAIRHQANLTFESEPGRETSFVVSFPAL